MALFGGSAVRHYTAEGRLDEVVELPVSQVTACTFGGPGLRELFITTSAEGLERAASRWRARCSPSRPAWPGTRPCRSPAERPGRHESPARRPRDGLHLRRAPAEVRDWRRRRDRLRPQLAGRAPGARGDRSRGGRDRHTGACCPADGGVRRRGARLRRRARRADRREPAGGDRPRPGERPLGRLRRRRRRVEHRHRQGGEPHDDQPRRAARLRQRPRGRRAGAGGTR